MMLNRCKHCCLLLLLSLLLTCCLTGCGKKIPASAGQVESGAGASQGMENGADTKNVEKAGASSYVTLTKDQLDGYASLLSCTLREDRATVALSLHLPALPASDDNSVYVFAFDTYEDPRDFHAQPLARADKATDCLIEWPYREEQLFQQFVPALLLDGEYIPITASGSYITNPEVLADNQLPFPEKGSKKGLLLDPGMLNTPMLTELNVKHAIYNIPLSLFLDEDEASYPDQEYTYRGKTYRFNGDAVAFYDVLFTYLTSEGMTSTAILLNDWDDQHPEMIHPLSREKEKGANYYAFNTAEEDGCLLLQALASFLASRYATGERGFVSSWVIANEINQSDTWNYMDTDDVAFYGAEFEKSLRIFYNAFKSQYSNARVYFSVDHDWNTNDGSDPGYFNARDVLDAVNDAALAGGNYDWGLALHPYPDPLTRVNYWKGEYNKTIDSPLLTVMNLRVVTDYMGQERYLDRNGEMRSLTITELGFSSTSGEKLQAAAFAYCYYIVEDNPHIDAFFMNRQTDAREELKDGLAFGIYDTDQEPKYIRDIFKYIDTEQSQDYTGFMLNILNADSLEEALDWAR